MKRIFITNLVFLVFLNLLVKPFWMFGIDRTVQNNLGAENYGTYFSLLSFSLMFNIILDIGLTNFNNRSIARDSSILPDLLSQILPLKCILGFVYALFCFAAAFAVGYSKFQLILLSLLIINNFLLSMILYLRSNISGLQLFRTDSVISVLDRFFMIILCSLMLWGKILHSPIKIEWFILAQTISYLITASIASVIVFRHGGKIRTGFSMARMKELLGKTYPFAILILLMSLFGRADSVMLERMLPDGKEQSGIYAQSFRILDAMSMFGFLFAGLLLPIFSRMIKTNNPAGPLLGLSSSLLLIPAFILVIVSVFYGDHIIALLYNEHLEVSSKTYPKLILSFIFISLTYIFGTLLTANGNLRQLNILAAMSVLLNIGLNLVLIPEYKTIGAAFANVITQAFFALGQLILCTRILKLKPDYTLLIRYGLYAILLASSGFFLKYLDVPWTSGALFLISLGVFIPWILRIIKPSGIYHIIRYSET